jgi:nucleotide-binding universal stress UspA family protein
VDGSPGGAAAAEFAFAEAATRGADLLAVHTWFGRLPEEDEQELPLIYDAEDVQAEQARRLAGWLAPVREKFPQVQVRELVRHGRPARALTELSGTAQLVVVGARGRGGFAGLLLGSVSQAVLHHAGCPVAIIRE